MCLAQQLPMPLRAEIVRWRKEKSWRKKAFQGVVKALQI